MGNVAEKFSDGPAPTIPQKIYTKMAELSPPADQSSLSLEWFDASESTPPTTGGPVVLSVKVMNGGGDVEAFWNAAKMDCIKKMAESSSPIETSSPPIFPKLTSRSPTSRFRNSTSGSGGSGSGSTSNKSSSLRTLVTRLHSNGDHHHRFVLKNPKRGVVGEEEEELKRAEFEMTADEKETTDEEDEEQIGDMKEQEEGKKNETSAETEISDGKIEENGPPIRQLSTPDVLSDIPFDILSSGTFPSPTSSNSPPILHNDDDDVATEDVVEENSEGEEEEEEEGETTEADTSSFLLVPTDVDMMKRQKKKERKKARQLNREKQMKRQRLQRTEALKSREEKLEKEKRQLAEYAAAVAKPTITQQQQHPPAKEQYTIEVHHQTIGNTSSISISGKSSKDAPMRIHVPHEIQGMIELKVDPKMQLMPEIVQVESLETFEVLVCGERRKVTPFIPRKKQNSGDGEAAETSTSSTNSVFELPEHPPVTVPFRDAPIVSSSQAQAPPPQQPQYVTVPMTFQSQPNHPVLVSGPIYGPPPPRYLPAPFGQPPPPGPQYSVGILPVTMQRIPMQRMQPVIMNAAPRPIFVGPPPPQPPLPLPPQGGVQQRIQIQIQQQPVQMGPPIHVGPTPQRPIHHIQQYVQVPPMQHPLVRPPRTPLAITAPPEMDKEKKEAKKKKKATKVEKKKASEDVPKAPEASEAPKSSAKPEDVTVAPEVVPEAPEAPESAAQAAESVIIEETINLEQSEEQAPPTQAPPTPATETTEAPPTPAPTVIRRSSSAELNGELITAGVSAILDETDDEMPTTSSALTLRPLSPTSEAQQAAINRVLGFSKPSEDTSFDIWAGWMNEMPPAPLQKTSTSSAMDRSFRKILEEDEKAPSVMNNNEVVENLEKKWKEEQEPNLIGICKKIEPYFMNTRAHWSGATVDSDQLRDIFTQAYNGQIPTTHWRILEKVCSFQQGYFHVFDVLIGNSLELTYKFVTTPEARKDKNSDELFTFYQSLPPVDGVENFYKRFEENIVPELIHFISNRFVSVRVFVAITQVVKEAAISVSDLYYLATLVYGTRQFFSKFNSRIKQFHIIESGGTRWIRQSIQDDSPRSNPTYSLNSGPRMTGVQDFLSHLRPHIDDILQLLPDAVVNDDEFFKAARLVCGWNYGDLEERIWKSIIKDRTKFQDFYDAYRPFLRIEIRMGTIYLRKFTYDDDYETDETDGKSVDLIVTPPTSSTTVSLPSSIKTDENYCNNKEKKKAVSFATGIDLIAPDAPPPLEHQSNESTQTDHFETEQMWDLERLVIRQLKKDNVTFAEFIESDDAREMHQFLIDTFKKMNLHYFAFILEKAMTETREQSWKETLELREAAEEARLLLETTREEHLKEFGELRTRMETISRFEAYEVQVASNSRIDGLKERIKELKDDREAMLREEMREERARMKRQMREYKEEFAKERRSYLAEIARLKEANSRLSADCLELATRHHEHTSRSSEIQHHLMETSSSSRIPLPPCDDSMDRPYILVTPDPEPEEPIPEVFHQIPVESSSFTPPPTFDLSPEARRQLKKLQKFSAEFKATELREFARNLVEWYSTTKANHKERKTAEKQLKEYEKSLDLIENSIKENLELLSLNVIEGLHEIPDVPMPFSDRVMEKMFEYSGEEMLVVEEEEEQKEEKQEIPEENDGCLICHDELEENDETIRCDTCSKEYHYHCISKWLKINSICPACSRALKDPNEYPMLE